ncbi:hypothetical protein K492DRAFT_235845 [Lichtheimia hyalospora FSU 10163]|nr:hypothetical protein K492DRAFT_235845 [Lichtheimia hyalospora FSU 10163]
MEHCILDRIAFTSSSTRNDLVLSSTNLNNAVSRFQNLCQERFELYETDITFTSLTRTTILKRQQYNRKRPLPNPQALRAILTPTLFPDVLGPLHIDNILITRNIHSMLTNNRKHIPYWTFKFT